MFRRYRAGSQIDKNTRDDRDTHFSLLLRKIALPLSSIDPGKHIISSVRASFVSERQRPSFHKVSKFPLLPFSGILLKSRAQLAAALNEIEIGREKREGKKRIPWPPTPSCHRIAASFAAAIILVAILVVLNSEIAIAAVVCGSPA